MGNFVCTNNFTVTKLLYQVDLVLGIDWLERWNPVIDWQKQTVNIWTGLQWECLQGLLLDRQHTVGTIKLFDYSATATDSDFDFTILNQPQFWMYNSTANAWSHSSGGDASVSVHDDSTHFLPSSTPRDSHSSHSLWAPQCTVQRQ